MERATRIVLGLSLAALVVVAGLACQPRPAVDSDATAMRPTPTTLTHDHLPPPRSPEN